MVDIAHGAQGTLVAQEKAKLRKVLRRFDLILFTADVDRPYRVPGGMAGAWAAAVICELFVVVTAVTLLWPGAINTVFGQSYSMASNWGVSRVFFESVTLGAFAVMVLAGVVFWAVGVRGRGRGLTGEAGTYTGAGAAAPGQGPAPGRL